MSFRAGSYSVDCPDLNGNVNENYTTILASSSTLAGSSQSSTSESSTFSPQQDSNTTETSTSQSDIVIPSPTTSGNATPSTSTSSSFAASTSIQLPTLSTTGFQSPTSSASSSSLSSTSSSQANMGSSQSGGKNLAKIIAPSVVIPVFIIVLIICVLWGVKFLRSRRGANINENNGRKTVDLISPPGDGTQALQEQTPAHGISPTPASDTTSIFSRFSFILKYPQPGLKDRTAEPSSP